MPKTLKELVLAPLEQQANKHGLGESYAENYVREMSMLELLDAVSDAMEEFMAQYNVLPKQ